MYSVHILSKRCRGADFVRSHFFKVYIDKCGTAIRGFMEEVPVSEGVVIAANVPRAAKCLMCHESIIRSISKKFIWYVNRHKNGQEKTVVY